MTSQESPERDTRDSSRKQTVGSELEEAIEQHSARPRPDVSSKRKRANHIKSSNRPSKRAGARRASSSLDTIDPALRSTRYEDAIAPPRSWSDVQALKEHTPEKDVAADDDNMDGRYPQQYAYSGTDQAYDAYGYISQQPGQTSPGGPYQQGNAIAGSSRRPAQYAPSMQSQTSQQQLERSPVAATSTTSSDVKLYACEFPGCGKSFNRRDYLDRHALNHSGRPTHVCELCGKGFARVDVYKKHQRRYCPKRVGAEDGQGASGRRATSGQSGSDDNHDVVSRKRQRVTPPESRSTSGSRMPPLVADSGRRSQSQSHAQESRGPGYSPPHQATAHQPSEYPGQLGSGGLLAGIAPSSSASSSSTSAYGGYQPGPPSGYPGAYGLQSGEPSPPLPMNASHMPGSPSRPTTGNVDDLLSWLFQASPEAWTGTMPPNRAGGYGQDHPAAAYPAHTSINAELMAPTVPLGMRPGLPSAAPSPAALHDSFGANRPVYHQQAAELSRLERALPGVEQAANGDPTVFDPAKELITSEVRNDMLNLFEQPLKAALGNALSVTTMRSHIDLYFMWSNPLYPILHRPTLAHRAPPPDLLMIMVCFGIAFTHDEALLDLAMKAHKRLRHRIFELVEETPQIPTSVLQTLLLVNYFGRMYCSALEHDISQIFHAPSMSLARSSGILLRRGSQPPTAPKDLVSTWLEWAAQEEKNRLAWFAFLSDTSNAALFRHYLLIHCFSMQCELPCANALWDAPDPQTWVFNQAHNPIPGTLSLRNALRDLLGKEVVTTTEDFGLWILLHGLLSVSWALLFRDLGALSMIGEEKIHSWKHSLSHGFQIWRTHVGRLYHDRIEGGANRFDMMIFSAGIPLCHLGIILGMSDTEEIRIFSGASTVAARQISPGEWRSAAAYCDAWARSEDGAHACWAALQLLNHVIHGTGVEEAPLITHWCMYLATLAVWTYVSILDGHHPLLESYVKLPTSIGGEVAVEPLRARQAAMDYLKRMLSVKSPNELAYVPDKNRCASIIAYVVHLASQFNRGILTEPRKVLTGLLVEHAPLAGPSMSRSAREGS